MANVDCYMLQSMVPPIDEEKAAERERAQEDRELGFEDPESGFLAAPKQRNFGGFDGCFDVKIEAEDPKINLNGLDIGRRWVLVARWRYSMDYVAAEA